MRQARRLVVVLSVVIVFVVGLGLCGQALSVPGLSLYGWLPLDDRGLNLATGAVLILIAVLAGVLAFVEYVVPESSYSFQSEGGEVRVAFSAIEDYVRRLSGQVPGLREMRPAVTTSKGGLEISARIILEPHASIPETSGRIQEVIRRRVQGGLGIEDIGAVRIYVVRIAPEEKARGEEKETPGRG